MFRFSKLAFLILALAIFVPVAPAQAISPRNPYKSFNLSGINYASMQWERTHRSSASSSGRQRNYYYRHR